MERQWRDGKPKWVVEDAEKEVNALKLRLALRWPDEARPAPMPFAWGAYDNLRGEPIEGSYWMLGEVGVYEVSIRKKLPSDEGWQGWRFSLQGRKFTTQVERGDLYETERDARLAFLWRRCDEAAEKLCGAWNAFTDMRGYV